MPPAGHDGPGTLEHGPPNGQREVPVPTIRSRRVLLGGTLRAATVVIDGERIVRVDPFEAPADFDAGDLVVMPSLVDSHVHINEPGRTDWEGFHTATRAAALGGVSTVADMPLNSIPVTTSLPALEIKRQHTAGKLWVDLALWGGVIPGNEAELGPMAKRGARGFKAFLCPSGIDEFPHVGPQELRRAMPILREVGRPLLVHAEIEGFAAVEADADPRAYRTYLHSRPPEWEDRAVALLIDLVRETGCRAHIVHLSSASALPMLRRAKAEGLPLSAETCPHYLCLRAEDAPDGATEWKCAPPIRSDANRELLWRALGEGVLDFVVTDHSPCVPALKLRKEGDYLRAWGGIASLQLGLASVATEAAARGFGPAHLSRWMTDGPAGLLGLSRRAVAPGAPADLVLWDPEAAFEVDGSVLAHRHPQTPYQGRTLRGRVLHHVHRGHFIVRDGQLTGAPSGRLLEPEET